MPEAAAPGSRRHELRMRAAAGVPAFLLVLAVVWWAPAWLPGLAVMVLGVYGTLEFLRMVRLRLARQHQATPLPDTAMLLGAGLMGLGAVCFGPAGLHGLFVLAVLGVMLLVLFSPQTDGALEVSGVVLYGLVTVPWFLNHATLLLYSADGRGAVVLLFLAVTFTDTAAFIVGKLTGRTPLLPTVSPNKTVEGALGGLAGGALAGVVSSLLLGADSSHGLVGWIVLGLLVSAAGQCGDLVESRLKRLCDVKDSGHFLPGHGGLLDRMDSFLLAAPLLYYLHVLLQ